MLKTGALLGLESWFWPQNECSKPALVPKLNPAIRCKTASAAVRAYSLSAPHPEGQNRVIWPALCGTSIRPPLLRLALGIYYQIWVSRRLQHYFSAKCQPVEMRQKGRGL